MDVYNTTEGNHGAPALPPDYKPNADELRVLAECRLRSTMNGGLTGALLGTLMYQAINHFKMAVHPRFGVFPKVGSASIIGFFFGKMLSIPTCYKQFYNLPNSPIGDYLRQKKGLQNQGFGLDTISDPNLNFSTDTSTTTPNNNEKMNSSMDIDIYSPRHDMDSYVGSDYSGGLDIETFNNDSSDKSYVGQSTISYADLRRKNREEYLGANKEKSNQFGTALDDTLRQPEVRRPAPSRPLEEKTKYGDVWG